MKIPKRMKAVRICLRMASKMTPVRKFTWRSQIRIVRHQLVPMLTVDFKAIVAKLVQSMQTPNFNRIFEIL